MIVDEALSAPVMVRCPITGGLVPTGVFAASLDGLQPTNLLLACPECDGDHQWKPEEAILASGTAMTRDSGASVRR